MEINEMETDDFFVNTLFVQGSQEEVALFTKATTIPAPEISGLRVFALEALVPIPEEITPEEAPDWKVKFWGTPWAGNDLFPRFNHGGQVCYEFLSSVNPAIEWLKQVALKFPNLMYSLKFNNEEGSNGTIVAKGSMVVKILEADDESTLEEPEILPEPAVPATVYVFESLLDCVLLF